MVSNDIEFLKNNDLIISVSEIKECEPYFYDLLFDIFTRLEEVPFFTGNVFSIKDEDIKKLVVKKLVNTYIDKDFSAFTGTLFSCLTDRQFKAVVLKYGKDKCTYTQIAKKEKYTRPYAVELVSKAIDKLSLKMLSYKRQDNLFLLNTVYLNRKIAEKPVKELSIIEFSCKYVKHKLSFRYGRLLQSKRICSVAELIEFTEEDLMSLEGINKGTIKIIQDSLNKVGLNLKKEVNAYD